MRNRAVANEATTAKAVYPRLRFTQLLGGDMSNEEIKKLRTAFKDVIDASIGFANAENNLESAVLTTFLISSPNMEAHKDEMKIVLQWAKELAGQHSVLSLFLMGLMVVKVEDGKIMCAMVDPSKAGSCYGGVSQSST